MRLVSLMRSRLRLGSYIRPWTMHVRRSSLSKRHADRQFPHAQLRFSFVSDNVRGRGLSSSYLVSDRSGPVHLSHTPLQGSSCDLYSLGMCPLTFARTASLVALVASPSVILVSSSLGGVGRSGAEELGGGGMGLLRKGDGVWL
jgi:hypothetical protein